MTINDNKDNIMTSALSLLRNIYKLIEKSEKLLNKPGSSDALIAIRIDLHVLREELIDLFCIDDDGEDYTMEFYDEDLAIQVMQGINDCDLIISELSSILRSRIKLCT